MATDLAGNADPLPGARTWTVDASRVVPVMVGAGDMGYCGSDNDEATARLIDNIPGQVFVLGDNTYAKGGDGLPVELSDYVECYGRPGAATRTARARWSATTSTSAPTPTGTSRTSAQRGRATPAKGYYDYRVGAWHVIVLNSNCADVGGCGPGSPRSSGCSGVLAALRGRLHVAMWHNPLYSSGATHGSDPTYRPFWQALYDHGADVILNGHDHVYERFGFQTPTGAADAAFGLRQFTVGTGGRSSYGFASPLPNSDARGRSYGVLKMTLHDGELRLGVRPGGRRRRSPTAAPPPVTAPPTRAPAAPAAPRRPPTGDGIAVVGSTSNGLASSRSSITIGRPAGSAAGDVLVAAVATNYDATISAPGRMDARAPGRRRGGAAIRLRQGGRSGSEPHSYTWTLSGEPPRGGWHHRLLGGRPDPAGRRGERVGEPLGHGRGPRRRSRRRPTEPCWCTWPPSTPRAR